MRTIAGTKDFWRASALLAGAILGVGIFGVPYAFAQAGMAASLVIFAVVTAGVLLLHMMYAEIIERTGQHYRLAGFAKEYLGSRAKLFSTTSVALGGYAALVAYILVAEEFLNALWEVPLGIPHAWAWVFWAAMTAGIAVGLRNVSRADIILTVLLIGLFIAIAIVGIPHIGLDNFETVHWGNFFLPYGVILFALIGIPAIPEVRSAISDRKRIFAPAIIAGTLIPAILTLVFGVMVVGVSGTATSAEAITGLVGALGQWVVYVGAVIGLLAISTSFLMFAYNLRDTLHYDWKMRSSVSSALTMVVPMALIMGGVNNFIGAIAIAGALFGAIDGITIIAVFARAKHLKNGSPHFSLPIPVPVLVLLAIAFAAGGAYELFRIIT